MGDMSGRFIKGYELRDRIGTGGFGAVYRAYQSTLGREVAIKIILPGYANQPDFIRRFETEAQIIARLEHPYIVPLYDFWRDPGGGYLVMRYLRGGSLKETLAQNAYQLEAAAQLLDQVTAALSVAHRSNVVHRDIKPANILLDEDGNAYLTDFGIAKELGLVKGQMTEPGALVGSPNYLSPEQARSEDVSAQTDLYSVGVVLYEMLAGEHPFPHLTGIERLYKHLNDPLPLITTLDADVLDAINTVIQKATAKNPAHRYDNALTLAAEFREAAGLGISRVVDSPVELLTPREQEVLKLIIDGLSNREIARELTIELTTVKWYVTQIYQKLNVRSRVQAIVKARDLDLIVDEFATSGATGAVTTGALPDPDNPYKGLQAFTAADEHDFFGREKLTARLIARLGENGQQPHFLAVVGPSGSGKSSLVKAGLVPALWRGAVDGSDNWYTVEMMPGAQPLDELEVALTRIAAQREVNLHEQLVRDERGLIRAAQMLLPDERSELLLVVDQFEEVFTLVEDESKRQHFLGLLYNAATAPRSRVQVVVTLRADFYDRPLLYPDFGQLIQTRTETVLPLSSEELDRAIRRPAERVGLTFEDGLVPAIIEDVHYQPGALPLLQYALTELFEQRSQRLLTRDAYENIGRAVGALAGRAEEVFAELGDDSQEEVRQMFLRLVTLGEGVEDTRRRVNRRELLAIAHDPDDMDEVIDTFAAYRLLSLDHDPATRRPTVEVAHEALLREWKRLREWLDESRADIRLQQQLAGSAQEWQAAQQDPSFLLRGSRLEQFEGWHAASGLALTQTERDYLQASIDLRLEREAAEAARQVREVKLEQHARRVLLGLVAVLAVAALVSGGLAVWANSQRQEAQREADVNRSLVLAGQARDEYAAGHPDLGLHLALAATDLEDPPSTSVRTLNNLAYSPGVSATYDWFPDNEEYPTFMSISADGRQVLVGSNLGTDLVWDLEEDREVWRFQDPDPRWATPENMFALISHFSPDGTMVATKPYGVGYIGHTTIRDSHTGEVIYELPGYEAGNGFSPDSRYYVTAEVVSETVMDSTISVERGSDIIIWDLTTGQEVQRLRGAEEQITTVVFSPDGKQLASSSNLAPTIRFWDVMTGEILSTIQTEADTVYTIAYIGDGQRIWALADSDRRLYDVASGSLLAIQTHPGSAWAGSTTPSGRLTAYYYVGSSVWLLWDNDAWREVYRFQNTSSSIHPQSTAISPDEQTVLVGYSDGIVRRWDLSNPARLITTGDGSAIFQVAAHPNGRWLVAGQVNGEVVIWDTDSGEEIRRFMTMPYQIFSLDISPDGKQIAVGGASVLGEPHAFAGLWDLETGDQVLELSETELAFHLDTGPWQGGVWGITFSPDGQRLITASSTTSTTTPPDAQGKLLEWDVASGELLRVLDGTGVNLYARAAAFIDDGQQFVTVAMASVPGATVWDTATGEVVSSASCPENNGIRGFAILPDEQHILLTSGYGGPLLLRDLTTCEILNEYIGHDAGMRSVIVTPDGTLAASGDNEGRVIIWDVETGESLQVFDAHSNLINSLALSPDGQYLYSSSRDGYIVKWRITTPPLAELREWVADHRVLRDLTPRELERYGLTPVKDVEQEISRWSATPFAVSFAILGLASVGLSAVRQKPGH